MGAEQKPIAEVAVHFVSGPLAGKTLPLQKPIITIGRDGKNDIVITDPTVSRFHARIFWHDGTWHVENISQQGFISLQQQRVTQGVLKHNDVVSLSKTTAFTFLYQPARQPESAVMRPSTAMEPPTVPLPPAVEPPTIPLPPAVQQPPASTPPSERPSTPSSREAKPLQATGMSLAHIPRGAPVDHTLLARPSIPTLTVSSNIHSGEQVYPLPKDGRSFALGRKPDNTIPIQSPVVSAFHAQIILEDNQLVLIHPHPERERTANGLWYQGKRIRGNEKFRRQLVRGDIFRIGDEHGTFVTLRYEDNADLPLEDMSAMQPVPLNGRTITIGRLPDNTIIFDHPQISAHHMYLENSPSGYRAIDNNSTNSVYINGEQASNQLLRTGDEIRIGPYRLIYTGTELKPYDESGNIRIDALNLRKFGNENVILLNDISLVIPPRKFVALVGGSGAGKSTLMDALNGLRPAQEGVVFYNGIDYYRHLAAFSTQLGYVPQEDIVHRELTVERALYYAARLRLPSDFTKEQIRRRIDEVLEDVEMTERRSLLINNLSGGQRKRVSIALELLANPGVFFLDEPTSGLDPGLDRKMMLLLRRLADRGRTIILVTHATNNINTCDYVCFLAQGGRLAYFGPPNEAKAFFDKTDFAEIYSTLEPTKDHPTIPQQAEERFLQSLDYQNHVVQLIKEGPAHPDRQHEPAANVAKRKTTGLQSLQLQRVKHGGSWSQFILLSTRYLELLKNDMGNLLLLLLQAPVIAIMLVLMAHFEIGTGIFDANTLVQCRTQILTTSGPLSLAQARTTQQINCDSVQSFLNNDPQGQAYAKTQGGEKQALQKFLLPGPGTDAQKILFIMAFAAVLFGCMNGTREFVKEAAIYKRERTVNLGIIPYMFSKIAVLGLLSLLQSAVLVLIVNLGEPLHQGIMTSPILETYITIALTSLAGLMIGLTVSAVAPNNDRAISFIPIILIPQVIFSGAIIPLKDWLTQIVATVFPTRWAMAALGSSIGLHAENVGGDKLFGNDYTYHSTLFSTYSQSDAMHRLLLSWGSLGAIVIVLTITIGIFLKLKDVRS